MLECLVLAVEKSDLVKVDLDLVLAECLQPAVLGFGLIELDFLLRALWQSFT